MALAFPSSLPPITGWPWRQGGAGFYPLQNTQLYLAYSIQSIITVDHCVQVMLSLLIRVIVKAINLPLGPFPTLMTLKLYPDAHII